MTDFSKAGDIPQRIEVLVAWADITKRNPHEPLDERIRKVSYLTGVSQKRVRQILAKATT